MKKFENFTNPGNDEEFAVKRGKNLPSDAVNLRILQHRRGHPRVFPFCSRSFWISKRKFKRCFSY